MTFLTAAVSEATVVANYKNVNAHVTCSVLINKYFSLMSHTYESLRSMVAVWKQFWKIVWQRNKQTDCFLLLIWIEMEFYKPKSSTKWWAMILKERFHEIFQTFHFRRLHKQHFRDRDELHDLSISYVTYDMSNNLLDISNVVRRNLSLFDNLTKFSCTWRYFGIKLKSL